MVSLTIRRAQADCSPILLLLSYNIKIKIIFSLCNLRYPGMVAILCAGGRRLKQPSFVAELLYSNVRICIYSIFNITKVFLHYRAFAKVHYRGAKSKKYLFNILPFCSHTCRVMLIPFDLPAKIPSAHYRKKSKNGRHDWFLIECWSGFFGFSSSEQYGKQMCQSKLILTEYIW